MYLSRSWLHSVLPASRWLSQTKYSQGWFWVLWLIQISKKGRISPGSLSWLVSNWPGVNGPGESQEVGGHILFTLLPNLTIPLSPEEDKNFSLPCWKGSGGLREGRKEAPISIDLTWCYVQIHSIYGRILMSVEIKDKDNGTCWTSGIQPNDIKR